MNDGCGGLWQLLRGRKIVDAHGHDLVRGRLDRLEELRRDWNTHVRRALAAATRLRSPQGGTVIGEGDERRK